MSLFEGLFAGAPPGVAAKWAGDEDINFKCIKASGWQIRFPCDVTAATAVSVAIGAGGLALLFVAYLMNSVSR